MATKRLEARSRGRLFAALLFAALLLWAGLFSGCSAAGSGGSGAAAVPVLTPCASCSNTRISSHAVVWTGMDASVKNQIALAASASHAGMIRVDLSWDVIQPSAPPAPYQWQEMDETLAAAKKYGLEVVPVIYELPSWASSNPSDPGYRFFPPGAQGWNSWPAFISDVVNRYKGDIHYWEVWGEANTPQMWKGTPQEYAHLFSIAYDQIKKEDPTATVLMAGMTEYNQPGWLNAVLNDPSYPAQGKIDIIDVHTYGSFDTIKQLVAGWNQLFSADGVTGKKLWITEFSFPAAPAFQQQWDTNFIGISAADGEQKQSDFYNAVIPWMFTQGGVDRVFVALRDLPDPGTPWASSGILDVNAEIPKAGFYTIQQLSDEFRS